MANMKKTQCAPKIWAKFNSTKKKIWTMSYKMFLIPEYNIGVTKEQFKIIAHNHACQVVWAYQSIIKGAISKIKLWH